MYARAYFSSDEIEITSFRNSWSLRTQSHSEQDPTEIPDLSVTGDIIFMIYNISRRKKNGS